MKKAKTISSLFLAVLFLLLSIPYLNAGATELRYGKAVLSQMKNSDALLYVYDCLVRGCGEAEKEIKTEHSKYKINSDELSVVYQIFHADYPEYFWVESGYSLSEIKSAETVISVSPQYNNFTNGDLKKAKSIFENKVNELTQDLNGKSNYEKSLILHDRLADITEYTDQCNNHQNAYGALIEGKAVCAGYSKAYQHLLQKVNIPAWCVIGKSVNPSTNNMQNHQWNLVSLDGKWYYTDVTWDDQGDYIFYAYLNITTHQIEQNHIVTEFAEFLPKTNATDANYFVKHNLVYNNIDLDKLVKNFTKLNDYEYKTRIYVNGNAQTFLNNLYDNLNQLTQKMGIPASHGCKCYASTIGGEINLSIKLTDPNHKHNLTYVAAKSASSTAKGNIAYYTCNCGKWFSDANAQIEITNKQSVYTNQVDDTSSGLKNNQNSTADTESSNHPDDISSDNNSTEDVSSESSTTTEDTSKTKPKKKNIALPIAISVGSIIVIGGVGVGTFFFLKRK